MARRSLGTCAPRLCDGPRPSLRPTGAALSKAKSKTCNTCSWNRCGADKLKAGSSRRACLSPQGRVTRCDDCHSNLCQAHPRSSDYGGAAQFGRSHEQCSPAAHVRRSAGKTTAPANSLGRRCAFMPRLLVTQGAWGDAHSHAVGIELALCRHAALPCLTAPRHTTRGVHRGFQHASAARQRATSAPGSRAAQACMFCAALPPPHTPRAEHTPVSRQ